MECRFGQKPIYLNVDGMNKNPAILISLPDHGPSLELLGRKFPGCEVRIVPHIRPLTYCVNNIGDPGGIYLDRVFSPAQMAEFMGGLDYLVVTMPHTASTAGLIGEKELRMLPPAAVLINPARAKIIDEDVFFRCMKEGWIRGASIDVHYAYPLPPGHPVWKLPNLVMTPHISGSGGSPYFLSRAYDIFIQNLERQLKNEPLLNELSEAHLRGL